MEAWRSLSLGCRYPSEAKEDKDAGNVNPCMHSPDNKMIRNKCCGSHRPRGGCGCHSSFEKSEEQALWSMLSCSACMHSPDNKMIRNKYCGSHRPRGGCGCHSSLEKSEEQALWSILSCNACMHSPDNKMIGNKYCGSHRP